MCGLFLIDFVAYSSFVQTERTEVESVWFSKSHSGYFSMSILFAEYEKHVINHLLLGEIKEYFENSSRSVCSLLSNRWSKFHIDLNPTKRSIRDHISLHCYSIQMNNLYFMFNMMINNWVLVVISRIGHWLLVSSCIWE